jgi:large subunit ribosomal protein L7/L12
MTELLEKVNALPQAEKQELLINAAEKLTLVEILALVKAMETKWDVKASGGGGMMMMAPAAAAPDEEVEKTEFDLFLKEVGSTAKIAIIKEIRALTGMNLKDAKELVDKAPVTIKEKMPKEEAEKAKTALEQAGGVVELK